jgi:glyoxylase-like metal-dependent hydrolase (beta-lactamase superfamily II)
MFDEDFTHHGIEAFHVDGHTPGFTFYIFEQTLFICDYVFLEGDGMKLNPFGPADRTIAGSCRIRELLDGRDLATVCGYNYVIDYPDWRSRFDAGPPFGGF